MKMIMDYDDNHDVSLNKRVLSVIIAMKIIMQIIFIKRVWAEVGC